MNTSATEKETFLVQNVTAKKIIFLSAFLLCLTPFVSPPIALLMGIIVAQFSGHPYLQLNHKAIHLLLQISVVGLGFGMNVATALRAGKQGILFTIASIFGTLFFGFLLGMLFKTNKKVSYLISTGTAICGGSAIAAIAPVIKAEEKQITVALGTVFILNSAALILFPIIGHALHLSASQFGLWCAIAIHDTSSVVGAASRFGNDALETATTVKLARALWIVPIAFFSSMIFKSKDTKIKIPYFIGLFIVAIIANTYFASIQKISTYIVAISKIGLTVTLFLIGCGLSKNVLKSVGLTSILQGLLLWIIVSVSTLLAILV